MAGIPTMELIETVRPRLHHRLEEVVASARARLKTQVAAQGPSALTQRFEAVLAELTVVLEREDRMAIPLASQLVQGPVLNSSTQMPCRSFSARFSGNIEK